MTWQEGNSRYDVTLTGTIAFTDDLTNVQTLSEGGRLTIRDWSHGVERTVDVRSSGGQLTRTYAVAGRSRAWDAEAQRLLSEDVPILVRRSGLGADSRVKSIYQKGGVSGVLEEIALLESDYVRRLYYEVLLDAAPIDAGGVRPLLQQVQQRMTSDYDRRLVLQRVANRVHLDDAAASAFVHVIGSMRSDYDRRNSLTALFNAGGWNADPGVLLTVLNQVRSSYDKRLVLEQLMPRGLVSLDMKRTVLQAAAGAMSDYDRALVLVEYVKSAGVESALRDHLFAAVNAISSPYDKRRVLTTIAERPVAQDVQQRVFSAVANMSSDYDRAETLLSFIGTQHFDTTGRRSLVAAAERIRSSYDQNRVLAALVRSERR